MGDEKQEKQKQKKKQKKKQKTPHGAYGPGGASSGYKDMLEKAYRTGNKKKDKDT